MPLVRPTQTFRYPFYFNFYSYFVFRKILQLMKGSLRNLVCDIIKIDV